jgi:hypothetical protein
MPQRNKSGKCTGCEKGCNDCKMPNQAFIICPARDFIEDISFSKSESSCTDFSDLKCKTGCEQSCSSSSSCSSFSSCSSSSEDSCNECRGCKSKCNNCDECFACGCKQCCDYSESSVLRALACSSSSDCDNHRKSHKKSYNKKYNKKYNHHDKQDNKGKKLLFRFDKKNRHQWCNYNDSNTSIYVNGKEGPVLHLHRGTTYKCCIEKPSHGHALIFTDSPIGGAHADIIHGGFSPLDSGCASFKVDKNTPRYFFYQDTHSTCAGGLVIVHNK